MTAEIKGGAQRAASAPDIKMRRASNPLPRPWQGRALPSELLPLGQRRNDNPPPLAGTSLGLWLAGAAARPPDQAPHERHPMTGRRLSSDSKISSMRRLNVRASENARGRLGSYLPVSIAFTVWRDTPSRSASSACDQLSS